MQKIALPPLSTKEKGGLVTLPASKGSPLAGAVHLTAT